MRIESAFLDTVAAAPFAGQRVLLTGASGFLGWHIARQGLAARVEVHCLGRSPGPNGTRHHAADLLDRAAVRRVVSEVQPQAVLHCAAPGVAYGQTSLPDMLAVSVLGTEALLDACAAQDDRPRILLVGSGFEYSASECPVSEDWPIVPAGSQYGAAKAAAAAAAGAFADRLSLTLLRPFHIYGAGEAERRLGPFLIGEARSGRTVELTACEQQRDFLHVDDCAAMLWSALARSSAAAGFDVCNIGSGQPITLRTFIEVLAAGLAQNAIPADCRIGALPYRAGEPMVSLPDLTRWHGRGGRTARVSLAEGVADLVTQELARCG